MSNFPIYTSEEITGNKLRNNKEKPRLTVKKQVRI